MSAVAPRSTTRPVALPADSPAVPPPRATRWRAAATRVILLVPVVVVSVCFLPGHMSNDTLTQIQQARDGTFTNHHAPVLSALWSLVWPLGVGPGWILVAQVATFVAGTYLVLRSFFTRRAAAFSTVVVSLSPPVFGMLGYLSRDTWFTALLMAAFGLVAWSARRVGRRSSLLLGAAVLASWLALASRQNAITSVAVVSAAIVWRAWGHRLRGGRLRRGALVGGAGLVLTVAMYGSQVVAHRLLSVRNVHPEQYVFIYDLAMLSQGLGRNVFPPDVMPRQDFAVISRYFNVDSVNPLLFSPDPPVRTPLARGSVESLSQAWKRNIADHPGSYLEGRWRLWLRQISATRKAVFVYHPVVDPNRLGQRVTFPEPNRAARTYVESFADPRTLDGSRIHTVWLYLAVAVLGAIVLLRRRLRPDHRLVGLLGLSAATHQVGLFFGAMGTQYRFQFPVVVVGMVVLLVLVRRPWRAGRVGAEWPAPGVRIGGDEPPPATATPTASTSRWPRTAPGTPS